MSLDKAIKSGKEYRKPYRKAKSIDSSCRNHGICPHCQGNRMIKNIKRLISSMDKGMKNDELD